MPNQRRASKKLDIETAKRVLEALGVDWTTVGITAVKGGGDAHDPEKVDVIYTVWAQMDRDKYERTVKSRRKVQ